MVHWSRDWNLVNALDLAGKFGIVVAVFFAEADDRQKAKHYRAWDLINSARGSTGDGGRRPALEDLNQDQVSLAATSLFKAYLFEVQLPAAQWQAADLAGAILSKANLPKATLLEANLAEAHLMGAKLSRANLSEDYLGGIEPNRGQSLQGQPERSSSDGGPLPSDRDAGRQHQQRPLPDRTRAQRLRLSLMQRSQAPARRS